VAATNIQKQLRAAQRLQRRQFALCALFHSQGTAKSLLCMAIYIHREVIWLEATKGGIHLFLTVKLQIQDYRLMLGFARLVFRPD
jgi:hypothetical protein